MTDAPVQQFAAGAYQQAWGPFLEAFGATLSPAVKAIVEEIGQKAVKIQTSFAQPPITIVHGDYRVDNLFFASPQGGAEFAVADWQIVFKGNGAFDLAYLLTGSLETEVRRAHERELLACYHAGLVAGGVKGYSLDDCRDDYRFWVMLGFAWPVVAIGTLDTANERGVALFRAWVERAMAAMVDWKAWEMLPKT